MPELDQNTIEPFDKLLEVLQGTTNDELNAAVRDCIAGIMNHGGKASLILKVTFARAAGHDSVIDIKDDVQTKIPKAERKPALAFTNQNFDLLHQPQRQTDLLEQSTATITGGHLTPVTPINNNLESNT